MTEDVRKLVCRIPEETLRDYVAAGYHAKQPLRVLRGDKQITLPQANTEKGAGKKPSGSDAVQDQLDAIKNAGGR